MTDDVYEARLIEAQHRVRELHDEAVARQVRQANSGKRDEYQSGKVAGEVIAYWNCRVLLAHDA
jgi:hypothetical protein